MSGYQSVQSNAGLVRQQLRLSYEGKAQEKPGIQDSATGDVFVVIAKCRLPIENVVPHIQHCNWARVINAMKHYAFINIIVCGERLIEALSILLDHAQRWRVEAQVVAAYRRSALVPPAVAMSAALEAGHGNAPYVASQGRAKRYLTLFMSRSYSPSSASAPAFDPLSSNTRASFAAQQGGPGVSVAQAAHFWQSA